MAAYSYGQAFMTSTMLVITPLVMAGEPITSAVWKAAALAGLHAILALRAPSPSLATPQTTTVLASPQS
jgi:hypothetical protein